MLLLACRDLVDRPAGFIPFCCFLSSLFLFSRWNRHLLQWLCPSPRGCWQSRESPQVRQPPSSAHTQCMHAGFWRVRQYSHREVLSLGVQRLTPVSRWRLAFSGVADDLDWDGLGKVLLHVDRLGSVRHALEGKDDVRCNGRRLLWHCGLRGMVVVRPVRSFRRGQGEEKKNEGARKKAKLQNRKDTQLTPIHQNYAATTMTTTSAMSASASSSVLLEWDF